jgi:hypothetical protein
MKRLCAWCGSDLDEEPSPKDFNHPITHGICELCSADLLRDRGIPLGDFLGSLGIPTLLATGDWVVERANQGVLDMVGSSQGAVDGKLGGEVFECANATLPGGCGQTILCSACTVRKTVTETHATGESQIRVPVTLEVSPRGVLGEIAFLITTEKVGDRVLVQIEIPPE